MLASLPMDLGNPPTPLINASEGSKSEHQKSGAEVVDIIYKNQPEEIITSARGDQD